MRSWAFLLALCACWAHGAWAGEGSTDALSPFEAIRSLQRLQDQVAQGNAEAQTAQSRLLAGVAEQWSKLPPDAWQAPKNARAAITYLLSGGRPATLKPVIDCGLIAKEYQDLASGALAYAEGRDEEARRLLGAIDPRSLAPGLGGQVALVEAMLLPNEERQKAVRLLDVARLLAPGTLVEEAALRREIFMAGDVGGLDRFVTLSRQYVHRFQNSAYFTNFRQRLIAQIANQGVSNDRKRLQQIEDMLDELQPADQRELYLAIAQAAVVKGRTEEARFAAAHAAVLSVKGSAESARAALYLAAASIVTDDYDKGIEALKTIDRSRLAKGDIALLDAAMQVAGLVHRAPQSIRAAGAQPAIPTAPGEVADEGGAAALIDQAQKSIAAADQLLKGPPK